jgi:nucleotidyltransferase/DNA polymerase involved in DNA repair
MNIQTSRALVIDEAYLDVTHNKKKGNLSATLLAQEIRQRILTRWV